MTNEVKTYKHWRYNPNNDWLYCITDKQVYNMQLFYYISTQSSQDRIYFNCPIKMTNEVKTYKHWRYNPNNDWFYCITDKQVYNMQLFYISTQISQDRIYFNCPPTDSEVIGQANILFGSQATRDEAYAELLDILRLND